MTKRKIQALTSIAISASSSLLLAAFGGNSSNDISVSAVAKCAHAEMGTALPASSTATPDPTIEVNQKVVSGGVLTQVPTKAEANAQAYDLDNHIVAPETPKFTIYVFNDSKTAKEAFKLIANSPKAEEEWGSGGTYQQANIVITTPTYPSTPLAASIAQLVSKCAVQGPEKMTLRPRVNLGPPTKTQESSTATTNEAAPEYTDGSEAVSPGEPGTAPMKGTE